MCYLWQQTLRKLPDPMEGLRPPRVTDKPVPVFTGQELSRLDLACVGVGKGCHDFPLSSGRWPAAWRMAVMSSSMLRLSTPVAVSRRSTAMAAAMLAATARIRRSPAE